jgi:RNA polymerase sigma-70 factor (ECF subfamily)
MSDRRASHSAAENERRGETAATVDLNALIVAHHAVVYRYACRLCRCPTEAEDLTQQTFLIAQQKLHQLREAERACGWLLAVVRSCFLKSLRKLRPTPAQDADLAVEQIADETPEIEQIDREELHAALAELPDEFRVVLLMFYFEELSYQEIAEQLDVPIGTVMSRLSRAKGHLRQRLAPPEPSPPNVVPPPRSASTHGGAKPAPLRATP